MSARHYTASCHCGAVRLEAELDLTRPVMQCNCSLCARLGWLLAFAPASQVKVLAGDDAVTDYQFARKRLHHLFCATCGVRVFSRGTGPDGAATYAVNVRCLDGVDPATLAIHAFDGRNM